MSVVADCCTASCWASWLLWRGDAFIFRVWSKSLTCDKTIYMAVPLATRVGVDDFAKRIKFGIRRGVVGV